MRVNNLFCLLVCLSVCVFRLQASLGSVANKLSHTNGQFDPYVDNGGTIVGIAGSSFVLLAADTRLSDAYSIKSRDISRLFEVSCVY